jgi:hypothetical protein
MTMAAFYLRAAQFPHIASFRVTFCGSGSSTKNRTVGTMAGPAQFRPEDKLAPPPPWGSGRIPEPPARISKRARLFRRLQTLVAPRSPNRG